MARFWHFGGLSWKQLSRRVWHAIMADDVFGQSAKLSFYFLLGLFPLLLFLTTSFGYFAHSEDLRTTLLAYFRRMVPRSAFRLIVDTLNQITTGAGGGKLSIGLLAWLWAASSGMVAIAEGLNAAYEIRDERPWWKLRLVAIGLTIAFAAFTFIGLALALAGAKVGALIAAWAGYQDAFVLFWNVVRWPIALAFVLIAVNLLYRFAPDLKDSRWVWMTPGAVVALSLWVSASFGFRMYLRFFNTYNATYGSLGAVIILMLWFYITGAAILIGAEVNSEIEHAAAEAGEPDAHLPGEKRAGEKRRSLVQRLWPRHRHIDRRAS